MPQLEIQSRTEETDQNCGGQCPSVKIVIGVSALNLKLIFCFLIAKSDPRMDMRYSLRGEFDNSPETGLCRSLDWTLVTIVHSKPAPPFTGIPRSCTTICLAGCGIKGEKNRPAKIWPGGSRGPLVVAQRTLVSGDDFFSGCAEKSQEAGSQQQYGWWDGDRGRCDGEADVIDYWDHRF